MRRAVASLSACETARVGSGPSVGGSLQEGIFGEMERVLRGDVLERKSNVEERNMNSF